jgi:predicted nucleic acid-binding Zn ribbon protein
LNLKSNEVKSVELVHCPFCGKDTDDDSTFCSNCDINIKMKLDYADQKELEKFCSKCGEIIAEGAKYCRMCGKGING